VSISSRKDGAPEELYHNEVPLRAWVWGSPEELYPVTQIVVQDGVTYKVPLDQMKDGGAAFIRSHYGKRIA
jgi:hypothetical protein